MSASIAMRLVPEKDIPKAFSIIFGGVSAATFVSGPVGNFLEAIIGWRPVFVLCAVFGGVGLIWQALTPPSMPVRRRTTRRSTKCAILNCFRPARRLLGD